jgi:hypothetical protein
VLGYVRQKIGQHFDQLNQLVGFEIIVVMLTFGVIRLMASERLAMCFVENRSLGSGFLIAKHIEAQCANGLHVDILAASLAGASSREHELAKRLENILVKAFVEIHRIVLEFRKEGPMSCGPHRLHIISKPQFQNFSRDGNFAGRGNRLDTPEIGLSDFQVRDFAIQNHVRDCQARYLVGSGKRANQEKYCEITTVMNDLISPLEPVPKASTPIPDRCLKQFS